MSYKGYYVLKKILSEFNHLAIDKIISSRDNKVEKDFYDEIMDLSVSSGIQFFDRNDLFVIETEYIVAISWRWIIKTEKQLIVLHDSLLPRYRGFSPLVNCLINEEKTIGVTAIIANDEYDTGEIIDQREVGIEYPIKIFEAIEVITPLYFEIIREIISKIITGKQLIGINQDESLCSYSLWRDEEDYRIDWSEKASYIKRFIDSLGFPFLGASSFVDNKKVRIVDAEEFTDVKIENRTPGKVIFIKRGYPVVVCGEGLLLLTKVNEDDSGKSALPLNKIRILFK
jgi:methionyl-tRNA formyltransferase